MFLFFYYCSFFELGKCHNHHVLRLVLTYIISFCQAPKRIARMPSIKWLHQHRPTTHHSIHLSPAPLQTQYTNSSSLQSNAVNLKKLPTTNRHTYYTLNYAQITAAIYHTYVLHSTYTTQLPKKTQSPWHELIIRILNLYRTYHTLRHPITNLPRSSNRSISTICISLDFFSQHLRHTSRYTSISPQHS